jgi:predicted transcriptional regulator
MINQEVMESCNLNTRYSHNLLNKLSETGQMRQIGKGGLPRQR